MKVNFLFFHTVNEYNDVVVVIAALNFAEFLLGPKVNSMFQERKH